MEKTLIMVKPDGVIKGSVGKVLTHFEEKGLKIVAARMVYLSKDDAKKFYFVHRERPFYDSLTDFMSSAPILAAVLEGENAISRVREIMGATNPKDAKPGTIRSTLAENVERNVVHGSDSPESAACEIPFFFNQLELCSY
ncbi:MAG: nucleoside-diphosphate kinase [bacterium]